MQAAAWEKAQIHTTNTHLSTHNPKYRVIKTLFSTENLMSLNALPCLYTPKIIFRTQMHTQISATYMKYISHILYLSLQLDYIVMVLIQLSHVHSVQLVFPSSYYRPEQSSAR